MNKSGLFTLLFALLILSINTWAQTRPMIWVTPQDKQALFNKVTQHEWAKKRYMQLRKRAELAAPVDLNARKNKVLLLPLHWEMLSDSESKKFPAFIKQQNVGNNHLRHPLQKGLQNGIDCGVLYYLSREEMFAHCAADILHTVVQALKNTPIEIVQTTTQNQGWIIPANHLLEARIFSAQIPIIYDFVHTYLKDGGKVYDAYHNKLTNFDFEAAQDVFITYAEMALQSGLIDNNWPVLESASLVHNALAVDNEQKRNELLSYYLINNTPNQDSLLKVAKQYEKQGDIWPESLNYSKHVAYRSLYLMTLLDRLYPKLTLGKKFPNIATSLLMFDQLRFPNGDFPAFGDGNRRFDPDYANYELGLTSALLNENHAAAIAFSNKLNTAISSGQYNRSIISKQHTSAAAYTSPVELLWSEPSLNVPTSNDESKTNFETIHTSFHLPFAGFFVQRNIQTKNPVQNGLMAASGGGSYVHGHASGIDLELYGQGHVLGVEAGKGTYTSDVHHNYHRLFAGHNTVISNGASASKGDWINLGINTVEKAAMEPLPTNEAVSPYHSFVSLQFFDEHNLVAPAYHQRTTGIIRLSDTQGYYLDIFKAKSNNPDQYHDYLFRGLADNLKATKQAKLLNLVEDNQRYMASSTLPWVNNRKYKHPGWHFFEDVNTTSNLTENIEVLFTANKLADSPILMRAYVVGGQAYDYTQAKVPYSKIEPAPYNKKKLPIMVLRQQGDAWNQPFVVLYESYQSKQAPAIQSAERITQNGNLVGIKVYSQVNGNDVEQFILLPRDTSKQAHFLGGKIKFTGLYAVVTTLNQQLSSLYIGSGKELSYLDNKIVADSEAAYRAYP